MQPPPRSTLFPYTTLFRSRLSEGRARGSAAERRPQNQPDNGFAFAFETGAHGNHPNNNGKRLTIRANGEWRLDRKSTRLNSSHTVISYAVFCLKKKKKRTN